MKIRQGFVSNSSSSSFLIHKKNITKNQLKKIRNHIYYGKKVKIPFCDRRNAWVLNETEDHISGYTIIDNFDMSLFFTKIGINFFKIGKDYEYWTGTEEQIDESLF